MHPAGKTRHSDRIIIVSHSIEHPLRMRGMICVSLPVILTVVQPRFCLEFLQAGCVTGAELLCDSGPRNWVLESMTADCAAPCAISHVFSGPPRPSQSTLAPSDGSMDAKTIFVVGFWRRLICGPYARRKLNLWCPPRNLIESSVSLTSYYRAVGSNGRQKNNFRIIIVFKSINQLDKNSMRARRHWSQGFPAERCGQVARRISDNNYSDIFFAADADKAKLMHPDNWAVRFASL